MKVTVTGCHLFVVKGREKEPKTVTKNETERMKEKRMQVFEKGKEFAKILSKETVKDTHPDIHVDLEQ